MSRIPSIQALKALESFSRNKTVWQTAEELNLTRSAISHQLRGLEAELPFTLLNRVGTQVELSPQGLRYAEDVRAALRLLVSSAARNADDDVIGPLTISCEPSFASAWLCNNIGRFAAQYEGLDLTIMTLPKTGNMKAYGADIYITFLGGDMDDMFGDIFGNMFHGGSASGRSRRTSGFTGGFGGESFRSKGSDIKAGITVGFDEAAFGGDKVITLSNPENPGQPGQSLKVHIPAGIDNGKSIRLRGKGMPGTGGGEAGDLLLKVTVAPKPGYERKGMDVYTTVSVPYTTAVFGGEALVHTLYGDVMCKIKEGTQSGSKIRLRGKGIVSMKDSSVHGDQYVTIQIEVPRNLSPQARQKLKEFEEICQGSSRTA